MQIMIVDNDTVSAALVRHYGYARTADIINPPPEELAGVVASRLADRIRDAFHLDIPLRTIFQDGDHPSLDFEFKFASMDDAVWFRLKWL
jgi:hypothetical protein